MIDLGELQACETKEQVESYFLKYGITDFTEKRSLLLNVMGNPPIFDWCKWIEDTEVDYDVTLKSYVFGAWVFHHVGPCYNNQIDWNRRMNLARQNIIDEEKRLKAMGIYGNIVDLLIDKAANVDFHKAAEATVRDLDKLIPQEEPTTNECCGLTF